VCVCECAQLSKPASLTVAPKQLKLRFDGHASREGVVTCHVAETCTLTSASGSFINLLPARVFVRATCLSVCLSVTRRYYVKMKKASVIISSPSGSFTILVFWCQISSRHSKGFPPSGSLKQGWGGKIQPFFSFKHQYLENGSR